MEALINALKKFLMRDLSFMLGGSAVILSFLYACDRIPDKELPTVIYILMAGFAYVLGFAIQDDATLARVVRTKAGVAPNRFAKSLFKLFERRTLPYPDVSKYEMAKKWLMKDGGERQRADHERTESLKQIGTAVGTSLLLSAAILFSKPVLQKVPFDVALPSGVLLVGLVLWSLGWLKVTQQAQYVLSLSENNYDAGPFTDIASVWRQQLWSFLNEPNIIRSMTEASDNKRPVAEAIAYELHQRFGDNIRQDRVKQFIGFLIRQVMERNGYRHSSYGQQTQENPVFIKASTYSQRDE